MDENVKYSLRCQYCGRILSFSISQEQYRRYLAWCLGKGSATELLDDFEEDVRKSLVTGSCVDCRGDTEM